MLVLVLVLVLEIVVDEILQRWRASGGIKKC